MRGINHHEDFGWAAAPRGKGGAPSTPDYAYLATYQSNLEAAKLSQQTSREQLDWAKEQYADQAPYTKAYMQSMTEQMQSNQAAAKQAQARLEGTYYPIEDKFAAQVADYNTPARAAQESAAAQADVNQAFSAQRTAALQNLESYGIDPSQTRFGALDLGARISPAAAASAAGTQARRNTETTGLALEGEAINIGRGYPGQVAQAYGTSQGAGASGVTAGLNTSSTYGSLMGTPTQWAGLQSNFLGGATNAANSYSNAQLGSAQIAAGQSASTMQGIGGMVGVAGGIAAAAIIV
jgi:hypothetical protein